MKKNLIQSRVGLLAIMLVFSTVAPVSVSADDTLKISNTVRSSTHSGGVSTNGQDGRDGADGADGASVTTDGHSAVHIESYVDGELVEYVHEVTGDTPVELNHTSQSELRSTSTVAESHESDTAGEAESEKKKSLLQKLLQQLQNFLTSYVDIF